MKKKTRVAVSPLTNIIYCGTILKDGCTWGAVAQDVTIDALVAVSQHVLEKGGELIIRENKEPKYEITVKEITA